MPALESSKLNPAQMMILESFAGAGDADETEELMLLLRDFHASRLEREMERLDADGTLDAFADLIRSVPGQEPPPSLHGGN